MNEIEIDPLDIRLFVLREDKRDSGLPLMILQDINAQMVVADQHFEPAADFAENYELSGIYVKYVSAN